MISFRIAEAMARTAMKPVTAPELFAEIGSAYRPTAYSNGIPISFINSPSEKTIKRYNTAASHWFQNYKIDPGRKLNKNTYNSLKAAVVYYFDSRFNRLLIGYQRSALAYESVSTDILNDLQLIFRIVQQIKAMNFKAFRDWLKAYTCSVSDPPVLPNGALSKKNTVSNLDENFQEVLLEFPFASELEREITAIGILAGARCVEFEPGIMIYRKSEDSIDVCIKCAKERKSSCRVRIVNLGVNDTWSKYLSTRVPNVGDQYWVDGTARGVSDLGLRLGDFLKIPGKHKFSFYTLRHNFIAGLRGQGFDPGQVALLAGHKALGSQYSYGTNDKRYKGRITKVSLTDAQKTAAESIKSESSQYRYRLAGFMNEIRDGNHSTDRPENY